MSVRRGRLERAGRARLGLLGDPAAVAQREHEPDAARLEGLGAALEELPASQREAIRLRFEGDLPYEDVGGRAPHVPPGGARARASTTEHVARTVDQYGGGQHELATADMASLEYARLVQWRDGQGGCLRLIVEPAVCARAGGARAVLFGACRDGG
ncbi:MAG TPA: hypothetical protein VHX88_10780 [Solirubrobacteraceae bacterium]|jgi:hypothetical protein|nr:hypothetical protein [Solirubrobacteraceae bacterium]